MFGFWLLLSGETDALHLGLGILASLFVAFLSSDLFPGDRRSVARLPALFVRLIPFSGWLLWQIILSNIDVARLVLNPALPLSPGIIKASSRLKGDAARTALANAITLTPGTMTVDVVGGDFYIHCLVIDDEAKLLEGEKVFEERIGRLFGGER